MDSVNENMKRRDDNGICGECGKKENCGLRLTLKYPMAQCYIFEQSQKNHATPEVGSEDLSERGLGSGIGGSESDKS